MRNPKRLEARATPPAQIFAALGDDQRLKMLRHLSRDAVGSISALTADSGVSRQAITKHLHVLARAGLVHGVRRGRQTLYEFKPQPLEEARRYLNVIALEWEQALGRLKKFVEDRD